MVEPQVQTNRSVINQSIDDALLFFGNRFPIPPRFHWGLEKWASEYDMDPSIAMEASRRGIGPDWTNFGFDFHQYGGVLLTMTNVNPDAPGQSYSMKLIYRRGEDEFCQKAPIHLHMGKMEDIYCLGPGFVVIRMWPSANGEMMHPDSMEILLDHKYRHYVPGEPLELREGHILQVSPGTYHCFEAHGKVGVMEISGVNDDLTDNHWFTGSEYWVVEGGVWRPKPYELAGQEVHRFPGIIEDEMPRYLLCWELPGTPQGIERFNQLREIYKV